MKIPNKQLEVFTDGSCHTQKCIGAWVFLIIDNDTETTHSGVETNTTHNRMELQAIIKAIEYAKKELQFNSIIVYSDSQYACDLPKRKEKLEAKQFKTNKGTPIQNYDLVARLLSLLETNVITLKKVQAHKKDGSRQSFYNGKVDMLSRRLVRSGSDGEK